MYGRNIHASVSCTCWARVDGWMLFDGGCTFLLIILDTFYYTIIMYRTECIKLKKRISNNNEKNGKKNWGKKNCQHNNAIYTILSRVIRIVPLDAYVGVCMCVRVRVNVCMCVCMIASREEVYGWVNCSTWSRCQRHPNSFQTEHSTWLFACSSFNLPTMANT